MIAIYLTGCLVVFILILIFGGFDRNRITAQDLLLVPIYMLSSWMFVVSIIFTQLFIWIDSVTEELDDIIIWEKKK